MRRRLKKHQIVPMPKARPSPASFACNSMNVMSLVSSRSERISAACASMRFDRRSPPWRLGVPFPVSRKRAHQRMALAALKPNRSAACHRDMPPFRPESTRRTASARRRHAVFDERGLSVRARLVKPYFLPMHSASALVKASGFSSFFSGRPRSTAFVDRARR
jgi:hypothetical protein